MPKPEQLEQKPDQPSTQTASMELSQAAWELMAESQKPPSDKKTVPQSSDTLKQPKELPSTSSLAAPMVIDEEGRDLTYYWRFDIYHGKDYNPVLPPGLGESGPGKTFSSNRGIADRVLVSQEVKQGKVSVDRYEGKFDDNIIPLIGTKTQFSAEVKYDEQGQITASKASYNPPKDISFAVNSNHEPPDVAEFKGVSSVTTELGKNGMYKSIIHSKDGTYALYTTRNGKVTMWTSP